MIYDRKYIECYIYMTDENSDNVAVNNELENEATETQPETEIATPEPEKEEQKRVKIKDVIKDAVECKDCKKPMNIKTLRYSHPNVCEKKPSNIIDKPVKKYAPRTKTKIKVEPLAPEVQENNSVEHQQNQEMAPPLSKATPPKPQQPQQEQPTQYLNPYANLTQQQLIQLQMKSMNAEIMRRKQEKSDNMCKAMFQSRSKKSK